MVCGLSISLCFWFYHGHIHGGLESPWGMSCIFHIIYWIMTGKLQFVSICNILCLLSIIFSYRLLNSRVFFLCRIVAPFFKPAFTHSSIVPFIHKASFHTVKICLSDGKIYYWIEIICSWSPTSTKLILE